MEQDKERLAQTFAKRAQTAIKIIKILVISACAVAAGLLIFAVVAFGAIESPSAAVIGLTVFISVIVLLLAAVVAAFIYAKINLNKLKKLEE